MRSLTLTLAVIVAIVASPLAFAGGPASSLRARSPVPAMRPDGRPLEFSLRPRSPEIIGEARGNLRVTRMTAEQREMIDLLLADRERTEGDGRIADLRDLVVMQFLYLESTCQDVDAMGIRVTCGGPCNMVGLDWNEDAFHENVSIIVDGEEIAQVPGLPDPPGGAVNGFNIFGIEAGEHTFRIEELDTGTVDEVTFLVRDRQPFANPGNVTCEQGEVAEPGVACEIIARWGQTNTPRATNFLVYINGNPATNVAGNFGGVVFGGAAPDQYCFDIRGSWQPPGTDGDQIYVGCRITGTCCEISCEAIECPPVAFLDICQSGYGGPDGFGEVLFDWVNPEGQYPGGIEMLVDGEVALGVPNNAAGNTTARIRVTPFAPGETTLGIRGVCGEESFSEPVEAGLVILAESPFTDPIIGDVICQFDPELPNPNDPDGGELVAAQTATWTVNPDNPPAFVDVYVEIAAAPEGENRFYLGTGPGDLEETSVWPVEPEDRIVLQFFTFLDTGCYGSEPIACVNESVTGFFVRGLCSNNGRVPQIADAVRLLQWRFAGGPPGPCHIACDADGDGRVEIPDALRILLFLFQGGVPPFGWLDAGTPVCEAFVPGIPGFSFGCETPLPACSAEGPLE